MERRAPRWSSDDDGVLLRPRTAAALTLIGVAGLVLTAPFIDAHHVGGLEERTFRVVNDGIDAPFAPVWVVMQLGSVAIVPIVAVGALLVRRPRLAATTAVAGTVVYVLGKVVRHIVVRERPARILDDVVIRGSPSLGTGYLSGHTALAVTMAVLLTPYLGRKGRWVAWLLAAAVGLGRVYVGAHMPLDVLGGAALGLTIAGLVTLLLWAARRWGGTDRRAKTTTTVPDGRGDGRLGCGP